MLASKFSLPPIAHVVKGNYASYELDGNVIDLIFEALDQVKLLGQFFSWTFSYWGNSFDDWTNYIDIVFFTSH